MSDFLKSVNPSVTRRDFIAKAAAAASFCVLNCDVSAPQVEPANIKKALNDSNVIHGMVNVKSGANEIEAYLSRPKRNGHYPAVIVITGNSITEEYIQNTTAMLAQNKFLGIAPNIYSLQKETMTADEKRKVFAEQITDERIFLDLQSTVDFLKKHPGAGGKRIGIMGFCFGGRCALMFAAKSKEIGAVASFYGNLRTPPFANRKEDPLDVTGQIRVPVQGHYSENDHEIPLDQLRGFERSLKRQRTHTEIYTYKTSHGFFAYTRPTYDKQAAEISWQRTVSFFNKALGH